MLNVLIIALSGAFLAVFVDDILQDGMLFERYGKWVREGESKWKMPIGACIYCTGTWLTIIMYLLFIFIHPAWSILTVIATANMMIKGLDKIKMI